MPVLEMTVRLALVFVLIAAVLGKLRGAGSRRAYLDMFAAADVPEPLLRPVAVALVLAESVTALLLLVPPLVTAGAVASTLLFATLTAGVHRIVRAGRKVSCNCFGGADDVPFSGVHVLRNLALTLLSLVAVVVSLGAAEPTAVQVAVSAFAAVIVAAVVVRADDLVDLAR